MKYVISRNGPIEKPSLRKGEQIKFGGRQGK
jgi:hypothetical protein